METNAYMKVTDFKRYKYIFHTDTAISLRSVPTTFLCWSVEDEFRSLKFLGNVLYNLVV